MSKYTITIKKLKDNKFDFGLQDYPIFDKSYRETLNNNILNYYYLYEIGLETAKLFKDQLNNKMMIIMPYFNNLYQAQKKTLENLFKNNDIKETLIRNIEINNTQNNTGETTSNSTNDINVKTKNVLQKSPQGELKNQDINNYSYASEINLDGNTTIDNNKSKINSVNDLINNVLNEENYTRIYEGLNGTSYAEELATIKANLMNIDMLVINELRDLFMTIF